MITDYSKPQEIPGLTGKRRASAWCIDLLEGLARDMESFETGNQPIQRLQRVLKALEELREWQDLIRNSGGMGFFEYMRSLILAEEKRLS